MAALPVSPATAVSGDVEITRHPDRYTRAWQAFFEFSSYQGSSFECRLDEGPWAPCTSPWEGTVDEGHHLFEVRLVGNSDAAMWRWTVDATRPEMSYMQAWPAPFARARNFTVSWSAFDAVSGTAFFDVGYRRWSRTGERLSRPWLSRTNATGATFIGRPGSTYCFLGTATDRAGNVSGPSTAACSALPVDDTQLVHRGKWAHRRDVRHYLGTYSKSSRKRAAVILTRITGRRIALMAVSCARCGSVRVYWNGVFVKRVSLYSPHFRARRLFPVAHFAQPRTGTIRIIVASSGKPVIVDGLGVYR